MNQCPVSPGQVTKPRIVIRDKSHIAETEFLAEPFIIPKEKGLVFLKRPAQCPAEFVALELWNRTLIEEVARIQSAVSQELIAGSMQLVGAGRGHNIHLRTRAFSIFGSIGVGDHVKFTDGIHSQQFAAGSARSQINLTRARIFNSIEEENILLRTPTRPCRQVANRCNRRAQREGAFRSR